MSYRIEQEQTHLSKDRWCWATWIGAPDPELDRIAKVTWRLHHTFPQPVIEVTDRPRRFKIVLSGWGVFQIRAELELVAAAGNSSATGSSCPIPRWATPP